MVYNLFISHSWRYSSQYAGLVQLLRNQHRFQFRDYSVPKDDPIHIIGRDSQFRAAIRDKMSPCRVVIILAGVYATYSKWINAEINLAKAGFEHPKPIIAVEPWGSEKTSVLVKNAANEIVRWNTQSIVNAIRKVSP